MKLFRKLFRNKKASELVEKIMVAAFAVAASSAVIVYMSNVIIDAKAERNLGVLDGSAERNRLIPEEEGTEGLEYTQIGDYYEVTCYRGTSTEIVIPSTHFGLPVKSIGYAALSWQSNPTYSNYQVLQNVTSLTLGYNIERTGQYSFNNMYALTNVSLPDSLKVLGESSFAGCSSLSTITFPSGLEDLGAVMFMNCTSLSSITIPTTISALKTQTFNNCTALTNIYIPDNIQSIGQLVFHGDYNLSIKCQAAYKPTDWNVFWNCYSLGAYWQSCVTTIPTEWNVPPQ